MGGSLAALYIVIANRQQQQQQQQLEPQQPHAAATTAVADVKGHLKVLGALLLKAAPMHEKLLEETRKDKAEKVQLLGNANAKERPRDKPLKQSKLAERLRRSFRRREHSSLEIKRCESQSDEFHHTKQHTLGPPALATTDNINLSQVSQQHFSLSFGGGHINTALLLDSPDECTPPEYAYQHLSSVATTNTNSSSSLESSYELSELRDSQTSIYYWACPKNPEMGSEMSTAVTSTNISELPGNLRRRAEGAAQLQSRSEAPATAAAGNSSRSCSLTSDSSSARITRLQNFLFKNSNESSRSCQGHSNDGFTASSYNSSSGEWEQLGVHSGGGGGGGIHDLNTGSFPEECTPYDDNDADAAPLPNESSDAGPYYQYTLTSPNNPFLPEITARSYHSTYKSEEHQEGGHLPQEDLQLDCNVTSVKYIGSSTSSRCAQLPTPNYSRAGSQESSYSESIISGPPGPTPSPASSSSSTPGRHRRKLFSLNSPTRLQQQQQQQQSSTAATSYQQQQLQKMDMSASPTEVNQGTTLARTLNPFLATASSPIAMPSTDLRSKREEFLRATMKICLVVSPPASKLQLKSKSLTHLDGLHTVVSCQHDSPAPELPPKSSVRVDLVHQQSTECFTVSFQSETGQYTDEIYLPVIKGVTLQNALRQELHRRNLNFSQITVTDNNAAYSSLDPAGAAGLDEYTDVESLAGHHLVVTERDGSRKTLQKAASFGSRQRPPRLLSSASTEETSELATAPSKQIRQRWSSIFGVKNPQQSQLYELLNCYAKNGVPQRAGSLGFDHPALSDALKYLQNMDRSWRDFVDSEAMSENEVKIQTAIWELVTTEVDYIHALQTVTDLFLACLEAVQEERLLIEVDQHRLFSNIRSVCEANIKFWTLWLYPMVAHSLRTHEPLQCGYFHEGFITFASTFAPYKVYCAEQSTCQFYCKELNQNNSLFTAYLAWCESQKMCNRLRLADIVVRPMQRLTKYNLLLTAIKKHMDDIEQIEAMDKMIHSVENFVGSVNNHLTMRQESERLKGVMARIESYDVVDTNNEGLEKLIKQHSQMFDLCGPMPGCGAYQVRHLFMEGDHKFKDNVSKSDVHCFLLTDILLVCKSIAKKGLGALKVIRQPYLTDHLVVHMGHNNTLNCVYLNEFQVATTAFTLQCTEARNWLDALIRAKTIYQRLKRGISANYGDSFRFGGSATSGATVDSLGVRKSPINSSIGSHVSSANNSHSGSVEWNDSRNISGDFDKTNSMSSDEGFSLMGGQAQPAKGKPHLLAGVAKPKIGAIASTTGNTLSVQPLNHLVQSLPNLSMQHIQTNNTLLVPGTTTSHSGNMLLSPSHRGISYPPPSPTRVPLRRGMAFSTSTKNPPLLKTRNITSQNSINWHQIPSTPTPPSPRSQQLSPGHMHKGSSMQHGMTENQLPLSQKQVSHKKPLAKEGILGLQRRQSTETDV